MPSISSPRLPAAKNMINSPSVSNSRHLRVVWLLYFFQFAGVGTFITFINLFLHEAGLTGTEIGLVGMLGALFGMLSATLWGYLSDRSGRTRLLLIVSTLGTAVVAQFYPTATTFLGFAGFACLFGSFNSGAATLVDSLTLSLLGERREDYGRYRLGGTIGYILATLLSGVVFEQIGVRALFPAFGLTCAGFVVAALFLPTRPVQTSIRQTAEPGAILTMIRQPVWLILVTCVFLMWMASTGANSFLNIVLKNMGGSDPLIALTFTAPAIAELPFMAFSGALIRRFGATRLFWIATVGYIIRFMLYSQISSPGWAPIINAFAGPMYVMFWNSAINIANRMAPPGLAATAQGLIFSSVSLAGVVGAVLSGWLFDQLGSSGLFMAMTASCTLAFLLYTAGQITSKHK